MYRYILRTYCNDDCQDYDTFPALVERRTILSRDSSVAWHVLSTYSSSAGACPYQQKISLGGLKSYTTPDGKVRGASMGPIWGRQDPDGPHDGPTNFAIWDTLLAFMITHVRMEFGKAIFGTHFHNRSSDDDGYWCIVVYIACTYWYAT